MRFLHEKRAFCLLEAPFPRNRAFHLFLRFSSKSHYLSPGWWMNLEHICPSNRLTVRLKASFLDSESDLSSHTCHFWDVSLKGPSLPLLPTPTLPAVPQTFICLLQLLALSETSGPLPSVLTAPHKPAPTSEIKVGGDDKALPSFIRNFHCSLILSPIRKVCGLYNICSIF